MEEEKKGTSQGPLVPLLLGMAVLMLLSNGAWAVFLVTQSTSSPEEEREEKVAQGRTDEVGPMVSLDPFVVNLNEPGSPRYLRVAITLELRSEGDQRPLEQRRIPLRDAILRHLSDLDTDRLQSAQDKERLRRELLALGEELFGAPLVRDAYFTEFMIQ